MENFGPFSSNERSAMERGLQINYPVGTINVCVLVVIFSHLIEFLLMSLFNGISDT